MSPIQAPVSTRGRSPAGSGLNSGDCVCDVDSMTYLTNMSNDAFDRCRSIFKAKLTKCHKKSSTKENANLTLVDIILCDANTIYNT